MKIASVGSAFPKNYYSQPVLSAALRKYWNGHLNNPDVVDRMHAHAEIDGRFLALPIDAYYEMTTWGQANNAWIECAQDLGQQALQPLPPRARKNRPAIRPRTGQDHVDLAPRLHHRLDERQIGRRTRRRIPRHDPRRIEVSPLQRNGDRGRVEWPCRSDFVWTSFPGQS